MASRRTRLLVLPLLVALVVAATGCSTTMRDLPIPGTGVGGDTMQVSAEFGDALNLAQGAPVKVNGVDSGKVTEITVDDFTARVVLTVRTDARLREGATARLRYTTPLGEIFVDVTNPASGELMADDATLGLARTDTAPTVEDALASASLLVNGGGLGQLQTITEELTTILGGNEGDIRTLLSNARTFLTEANATTRSLDRVLTSLSSVSRTLSRRERLINRVVRDIRPAARVLRRATPDFTELLREVERFSKAANRTVGATREQLLSLLSQVQPVLAELSSNRGRMNLMLREITKAGAAAENVVAGDFLSIGVSLDMTRLELEGGLGGIVGNLLDMVGLGGVLDGLLPRSSAERSSPAGLGALTAGPESEETP
jgi:phospholipid/cholesterol/gamma-HCH transport system substrate-binding protein